MLRDGLLGLLKSKLYPGVVAVWETRFAPVAGRFGRITVLAASVATLALSYPAAVLASSPSWSAPVKIDAVYPYIDSVSCPSASFCVAVGSAQYGSAGYGVTYNGSSWSAPVNIDTPATTYHVSCTSASFCAVVDWGGQAVIYNGSSWSKPVKIFSNGDSLISVSCTSPSFCAAVTYLGEIRAWPAFLSAIQDRRPWLPPQLGVLPVAIVLCGRGRRRSCLDV